MKKFLQNNISTILFIIAFALVINMIHSALIALTCIHALYGFSILFNNQEKAGKRFLSGIIGASETLATIMAAGLPILPFYWKFIFIGAACSTQFASNSLFTTVADKNGSSNVKNTRKPGHN